MPPYTPRRVSAERDFPPGCGPGAVLTPGDRPTPYSRPLSAQRDYHRTLGTYHSYLRDYHRMFGTYHSYLLARSFGSGEAMELTTAPPLAAPDATATIDDDEEAEEENYWMPDEIDYVDVEEVLAASSQGVGGLPCRIPREHIDYDDVYYDDGVSVDMIDEFLRTMSSEEAAANGGVEEVCVICQDDLCREDRTVGILECGHRFHANCVGEWLLLKNLCPLCKAFGVGCFT